MYNIINKISFLSILLSIYNCQTFSNQSILSYTDIDSIQIQGVTYEEVFYCQLDNKFIVLGSNGLYNIQLHNNEFKNYYLIVEGQVQFNASYDCTLIVIYQQQSIDLYKIKNSQVYQLKASLSLEQNINIKRIVLNYQNSYIYLINSEGKVYICSISEDHKQIQLINQQIPSFNNQDIFVLKLYFFSNIPNLLFVSTVSQGIILIKEVIVTIFQNQFISHELIGNIQVGVLNDIKVTNDGQFILAVSQEKGISFGSISQLNYWKQGDSPISLQFFKLYWWPYSSINPSPVNIEISLDDKFIFIAARTNGVLIVDISQKDQPILFQHINIEGVTNFVLLNKLNSQLYSTSNRFIQPFKQTNINLSDKYPNLFNKHQIYEINLNAASQKSKCDIYQNTAYWGIFQDIGLILLQIVSQDPLIYIPLDTSKYKQNQNEVINSILIDDIKSLAVIPETSASMLYIYNILDPVTPYLKSQVNYQSNDRITQMEISLNKNLIAITQGTKLTVVDLSILKQVQLYKIDIVDNKSIECSGMVFAQNDRHEGIKVIKIGINEIQIVNSYRFDGAEKIIKLQQHGIILDGYQGIQIIDFQSLPEIKIISSIQTSGWAFNAALITNDKFLIVQNSENAKIMLIDISDVYKPEFIIEFKDDRYLSSSLCASSDYSRLFVNIEYGMWTISLISPIKFHLTYSNYDFKDNKFKQVNSNLMQVGDRYQIQFQQIYPINDLQIIDVFYHQNDKIVPLPHWIQLKEINQMVLIEVSKEGLDPITYMKQMNVILILTKYRIKSNDFILQNELFTIDSLLSQKIYSLLKDVSIIQDNNFVIDNFQLIFKQQYSTLLTSLLLTQNFNSQQIQQILASVFQTLQKSINYNPIYFYVSPNLEFDFDPIDKQQFIKSNSKQNIQLQISIYQQSGDLYVREISGLIVTYSQDKNSVKMQGELDLINQVMYENRIIFLPLKLDQSTIDLKSIVNIQIQDQINYPIQINQPLQKVSFIKIKEKILIVQSIQVLFNQRYKDGYVAVDGYLYFTFEQAIFQDPQQFPLNFKAIYQVEGSEEYFTQNNWLQFNYDSNSIRIQGQVPQSVFLQDITVTITANNGYEEISDSFVIKPRIASIYLVINIILQITSPIAGLFGIYKYRYIPYNIYFKNKFNTSNEVIYIGQEYIKKIPLLNSEYRLAKKIFTAYKRDIVSSFEKEIFKTLKEQRLKAESEQKKRPKEPSFGKNIKSSSIIDGKARSHQLSQARQYNINDGFKLDEIVGQQEDPIQASVRIRCMTNLISERKISEAKREKTISSESSLDSEEEQINKIQDYRRKMSRINKLSRAQSNQTFTFSPASTHNLSQQKIINLLQKKNFPQDSQNKLLYRTDFQDYLQQNFVDQQGKLKMKQIIQDIEKRNLVIVVARRKVNVAHFISQLNNTDSVLFISLKSFFARFLLQKDPYIRAVYRYIKNYCRMSMFHTLRDWYKTLVEIKPTKESDKFGQNIAFPRLTIKEPVFEDLLQQITIKRLFMNEYTIENNYNINLYLIKEVLFADALGLHPTNIDKYAPSFGESIHSNSSHVSSIQAFILIKRSKWLCIRNFFNRNYRPYGCSQNLMLPNWINFVQKSNQIILHGIPQKHDVEEILIRVYDRDNYILTQFNLKIINNSDFRSGTFISINNNLQNDKQASEQSQNKRRKSRNSTILYKYSQPNYVSTRQFPSEDQSKNNFREKRTTIYDEFIFQNKHQEGISESCDLQQDYQSGITVNNVPSLAYCLNQTSLLQKDSYPSESKIFFPILSQKHLTEQNNCSTNNNIKIDQFNKSNN